MKKTIHIFADVSGSMNELSKRYITANLIRYVRDVQQIQLRRFEAFNIRLFVCNEEISEVSLTQEEDFVLPKYSGNFHSELILFENPRNALILTDRLVEKSVLQQIEKLTENRVAFIAVGVDAKVVTQPKQTNWVLLPAIDISGALDFLLISRVDSHMPDSIADIQLPKDVVDNNDDDWS